MRNILPVSPGVKRKPDNKLDSAARSEALVLLEPLMRNAVDGSMEAICLLVRIACLIAQRVVTDVDPSNRFELLLVLQEVISWCGTTETCEDFLRVREQLDNLMKVSEKKEDVGTPEVRLAKMVKGILIATIHLEPAWLDKKPPDERALWVRAGASTVYMFCYHEAAETLIAIASEPKPHFRCVQRQITEKIIRPVLASAGIEVLPEQSQTPRIVSSQFWKGVIVRDQSTA